VQKLRKTHHAETPVKQGEIEYFDPQKRMTRRFATHFRDGLCAIPPTMTAATTFPF